MHLLMSNNSSLTYLDRTHADIARDMRSREDTHAVSALHASE